MIGIICHALMTSVCSTSIGSVGGKKNTIGVNNRYGLWVFEGRETAVEFCVLSGYIIC